MVNGGYSLVAIYRLLAVPVLVAEHGLQGMLASVVLVPGLSSCCLVAPRHVESSWIRHQILSPALQGGFFTTGTPGKSQNICF